jgi:site-specific recombinase XerD
MENFKDYLQHKCQMRNSSIEIYSKTIVELEKWLIINELSPVTIGTKDLLNYMAYMQNNGTSESLQRTTLTAMRHYFNYLLEQDSINFNPASRLFVKPSIRTVAHAPLTIEQLQKLYENYQVNTAKCLIHKVTVGLLVYQGLSTSEVVLLKVKDLRLNEGKIIVVPSYRTNERTLKLEGNQIGYLQRYLKEFSPTDYLFPTIRATIKNERLTSNYFFGLCKKLKDIVPTLQNAPHIRQSVIAHWTKQYDIRIVQYMAGHKWISSTQRYDLVSLETLQAEIDQLHPLNEAL